MANVDMKVALVTGGASGIGAAISERLCSEGYKVIVGDRNLEGAQTLADQLKESGLDASSVFLDLDKEETLKTAFESVMLDFGRLDVLVNNAGVAETEAFLDYPVEGWKRVFDINANGTFICSQLAARLMKSGAGGRIINVTSTSGMRASRGRAAYGSSKAAIIGLTRQMAVELAEHGITVNAVAPGPIETQLAKSVHSPETREAYIRSIPLARYGKPEEVAGVVAFLASSDASYINGHTIPVDGGYMAAGLLDI